MLKPEIQNEIVARLLPKIQANFRATPGRAPLDAHTESKLVVIMAQMKAKLIVRIFSLHHLHICDACLM